MYVITVSNRKGGVGKTTTAITLAHRCALAGIPTLLIDWDMQGNISDQLGIERGFDLDKVFREGLPIENVAVPARDNLWVLRSNDHTVKFHEWLMGQDFSERIISNALQHCLRYAVCVIDTQPTVQRNLTGAYIAADYVLIPSTCDRDGSDSAARHVEQITALKKYAPKMDWGVLPTMYDRVQTTLTHYLNIMGESFEQHLLDPIPRDANIIKASAYKETIWEFAPKSSSCVGLVMADGKRVGGYDALFTTLVGNKVAVANGQEG